MRDVWVSSAVAQQIFDDLLEASFAAVARPVHGPAHVAREAVPVEVDDVKIRLALRDTLLHNLEAFVDQGKQHAIQDFLRRDAPALRFTRVTPSS